ncbi:MAG: ABC transporter permease [Microbacterium sp.]|uniref:ABC transporter permease n=1 Tax=Microbacterium sp. TaxID=51671 RepID=UPI001ACFC599|nr:ABC transporter permease [Microbacterium sp.]MBN9176972.1 ABC transporter permease [Microbacterium sp.]
MTASTAPAPIRNSAIQEAIASSIRPPAPGPLSTSLTFGWRAMLKIKHIPEQLLDVTLFPVMFTLLFTFLFGGAIAGSTTDYVQFLVPGMIVQSVLLITMYTGMTLRTDVERGVFDRFRSLPVWRPSPIVGMLLGDAVRFATAATATGLLGLALGWRPQGGLSGVALGVLLLLVFAFSLGWVWTFLGLVLRSSSAVMSASMMVMMPLTFASNIFVDPATMPTWLRAFVELNPVSQVVTSVRDLVNGIGIGPEVGYSLTWAVLLVAAFGSLTMWRYRRTR